MRNYVNKSDLDNNFENLFFEEAQSEEVSFLHESSPSFSYNINTEVSMKKSLLVLLYALYFVYF